MRWRIKLKLLNSGHLIILRHSVCVLQRPFPASYAQSHLSRGKKLSAFPCNMDWKRTRIRSITKHFLPNKKNQCITFIVLVCILFCVLLTWGGGGLTIQDPLCSASGGHAFCSTLCHCDKMTQVLAILLLPLEDCFTAE